MLRSVNLLNYLVTKQVMLPTYFSSEALCELPTYFLGYS
jgi:hypothetical protein